MPKQYHCRVYWHAEPPLPGYLHFYCSAHHAVQKVRTERLRESGWDGGERERASEPASQRERDFNELIFLSRFCARKRRGRETDRH